MSKPEDRGEKLVYSVAEAGRMLGVSRNAAYEAAARREIPTIRIGKLIKVPKAAFDRLLAGETNPETRAG